MSHNQQHHDSGLTSNTGPTFQHITWCQNHTCARKVLEVRERLWLCGPHTERVPPADSTVQEMHTFWSQLILWSQSFGFFFLFIKVKWQKVIIITVLANARPRFHDSVIQKIIRNMGISNKPSAIIDINEPIDIALILNEAELVLTGWVTLLTQKEDLSTWPQHYKVLLYLD